MNTTRAASQFVVTPTIKLAATIIMNMYKSLIVPPISPLCHFRQFMGLSRILLVTKCDIHYQKKFPEHFFDKTKQFLS